MENHATAGAAVDACGVDQRSDEYRLLMAYCGKRKRQRSGPMPQCQGLIQKEGPPPSRHNARFYDTGPIHRKFQGCAPSRHGLVAATGAAGGEGNTLNGVADRLTQIADSVQITTDDIESDGTEDQHDVIRRLVELLKASGDKLNEEVCVSSWGERGRVSNAIGLPITNKILFVTCAEYNWCRSYSEIRNTTGVDLTVKC
ncbi:unnamed protein product [Oncorhynchus mykiss]|uniref:Uncharacterized protein n=1 Tax=Oncorhynchus mykiss TaxID=8022 RepID=A0A060YHI0_ONCMY|nr:unnamed protein product [Oncorhynchus mykiss]